MKINRRQFLKGSAAAAASAAALGTAKDASAMEMALGNASYNYIKRGEKRERVFTCSPLHPHDNPMYAWVDDDPMLPINPLTRKQEKQVVELSGVTESVRSRGRASAAEVTAWMQLYDGDRMIYPLKRSGPRGSGQWERISWHQAYGEIAKALSNAKPEGVALMRGKDTSAGSWERFLHTLGSNTVIDLDGLANQKNAWLDTWGNDVSVPDLAHSHYILNFGSNFFVSMPHYAAEALDGKFLRRARIITFDPRCSKTAGLSDEWISLKPGTDGVVALAMARYLLDMGWANKESIRRHSNLTVEQLKAELKEYTLEHAAKISNVPAETIRRIAREYGESGMGCVITGAGTSCHSNGYDTERAIMLLPLVAGFLENRGGNCLPRHIELGAIKPEPPVPGKANPVKNPNQFPQEAGKEYAVDVLFGYNTNPAFDAPSSALWRQTLADETRIKFFVAIGTMKNETWEMADIILPEAHWLERNEPVRGSGSLLPWVGIRQQAVTPPNRVKELREIHRDIIQRMSDPTRWQYWKFDNTREWLAMQLDGIPGLKRDGGWELMAKHSGVWPIYGYLHPEVRRIVDEDGEEVMPEYGLPVQMNFKSFPHWKPASDVATGDDELLLIVHHSDYHAGDESMNNKVIAENSLANHLHINFTTAKHMGIRDGDLVRVTSKVGYIVTLAHTTQTVRPEIVSMHKNGGHWGIGGIATCKAGLKHEDAAVNIDADIGHNLWWSDPGVHPMDIILPVFDETGGGGATATAVKVSKAEAGDTYGTVKVGTSALEAEL